MRPHEGGVWSSARLTGGCLTGVCLTAVLRAFLVRVLCRLVNTGKEKVKGTLREVSRITRERRRRVATRMRR